MSAAEQIAVTTGEVPELRVIPRVPCEPSEFRPDTYQLEVTDVRPYDEPLKLDEGTLWFDEWHVFDRETGVTTRYREVTGLPTNQTTDISIGVGTPWLTVEGGHNLRTLLRYMSIGLPGRLIGPPRIWVQGKNQVSSIQATTEASQHVNLGKDAKAFFLIIAAQDEVGDFKYSIAPNQSFYHAESRPAMFGFGLMKIAADSSWQLHIPQIVDPCLANATKIQDLAKLQNLDKIKGEVLTAGELILRLVFEDRRRHYTKTFDASPEVLIPMKATWNALSNGQAGEMAKSVPEGSVAAVTFNPHSVASQETVYKHILEPLSPNIHFFEGRGGHLGLAYRQALFASLGRVAEAVFQLDKVGSINDLEKVWAAVPVAA